MRCELSPVQVERVAVGQSAEVWLDGKAEAAGTGKVVFIGKVANRNSGLVPVVVRVANDQGRLRAEVPVKVRFSIGKGEMTAGRVIRKYVVSPSAQLPVVPVLAALGRTTRLPADQGRRHQVGGPRTDLRWDPAAPSPCPPGRLRRRPELWAVDSKGPCSTGAGTCTSGWLAGITR